VVDTNVWVSAALRPGGYASRVVEALAHRRFEAITSDSLIAELVEVLWRPRFRQRYGLRVDDIEEMLELVSERTTRIADPEVVSVSRDGGDDIFAAVALASRADYLVTRDDDLKGDPSVIAHLSESGCEVVSVRTFLERLAG
jgi:putative PIN family toxin of toxin-antitoxin system